MSASSRLKIEIDELVIHGLSPGDARVAAAALETELAALAVASEEELPARAESFRRLSVVDARVSSPAAVGETVAASVWSGLTEDRP